MMMLESFLWGNTIARSLSQGLWKQRSIMFIFVLMKGSFWCQQGKAVVNERIPITQSDRMFLARGMLQFGLRYAWQAGKGFNLCIPVLKQDDCPPIASKKVPKIGEEFYDRK
jgi:hypothetical protein